MTTNRSPELDALAAEALTVGDIQSAAIFVPVEGGLVLVGVAGLDGPPLDGLVAAVQDPAHPVARAVTDPGPTFDVLPMNPGGPKLRSHLPIGDAAGVLALAHEAPTTESDRLRLASIAHRAGLDLGA